MVVISWSVEGTAYKRPREGGNPGDVEGVGERGAKRVELARLHVISSYTRIGEQDPSDGYGRVLAEFPIQLSNVLIFLFKDAHTVQV